MLVRPHRVPRATCHVQVDIDIHAYQFLARKALGAYINRCVSGKAGLGAGGLTALHESNTTGARCTALVLHASWAGHTFRLSLLGCLSPLAVPHVP